MFATLEGLNDGQREAVAHEDGPLLIVAAAGTGKTRTLTARVARLVASGVSPERASSPVVATWIAGPSPASTAVALSAPVPDDSAHAATTTAVLGRGSSAADGGTKRRHSVPSCGSEYLQIVAAKLKG